MNGYVKEMVTKNIKLIKMIVKSKGKKSNKSAGIIIPDPLQILNIFYSNIPGYVSKIIEMKRVMESIGIEKNA